MREIIIENVKGIKKLEFTLPESDGVYLLVGANGMGKTTLLTCIDRIANPNAFAIGLKSANADTGIDQYREAKIIYKVDTTAIQFRKRSKRWVSTPKTKSSELLMRQFGFEHSVFIRADAKRLDVTQEEIRSGRIERASEELITALNRIFETARFSNLKRLKNVRGRGRQSTYFYILQDGAVRYSEKRFSTGEMAIIHLVEKLNSTEDETLFLLDEAELALHPRIQKNLLDYIKEKTEEKRLTVFIATHSVTMIKACTPQNIILLSNERDVIKVITPCYPAQAIGSVDFEVNTGYDTVIFVEDEMARLLLTAMVNQYMMVKPEKISNTYAIVPVGGYEQTAFLAKNVKDRILRQSKVVALLDEDAKTEGLAEPGGNANFKELYETQRRGSRYLFFLPCTPEVWFITCFENASDDLKDIIRSTYHCEVATILQSNTYLTCASSKPRKLAKAKFDAVIEMLTASSGENENVVTKDIINILVEKCMSRGEVMSTVAYIFG
ncbi:MAG: AAA family ATPase [Clostridiaceae bacterium]|nr:AAA family ATPase [Clostridiaceae bacterium]